MGIHLSHENHWAKSDDTMVSGSAFLDGTHFSGEELADEISGIDSESELESTLSRANGFFSVIHGIGDRTYAAVDHVRSWPLYYAVTDDVYVSDSAEWVHENGARRGYDPVAATEYLFTCFVPGKDTLSRDVKQVRAGEVVRLRTGRSGSTAHGERYFIHDPRESSRPADEDELDETIVDAVNRLIEYAGDRRILLGLSGGYDSRLIALMLSRLGYENVVTYTTHTASGSSREIAIARSIARDLDFEHIEVVSDQSDYRGIEGSEQMELIDDIGYLSEYPHINKVILRRKLKEAGVDPNEVVHVLGHQLLGAGTFLPAWVRDRETLGRSEFYDLMWKLHYSNWETPSKPHWRELFEGRMLSRVPVDPYRTGTVEPTSDAVRGFESWYWQERLPKYIIARREYEYLGFDVWYPLLDRSLYSFFEESGYRDRVGKRILKEYATRLDRQVRGQDAGIDAGSDDSSRSVIGPVWEQTVGLVHSLPQPAREFVRRAYHDYRSRDEYERDPRYSIVSESRFNSISFPNVDSNSLYRTLLLLYLYDEGYFDTPVPTQFDLALEK
jgi:asparagine synthase (glutamine-hydrolysing)